MPIVTHLVLLELFIMWWWLALWAVVYKEAAAAAAATLDEELLWSAPGVCSPSECEFSDEWPEWWWWWLFSADCWPSEWEDRERPGRARDGSLSIMAAPFVAPGKSGGGLMRVGRGRSQLADTKRR